MQSLHAHSVEDLEEYLKQFGSDFLFRGQTSAYFADDGLPNLNSSFVRKGCMPPLMLKWITFTEELLRRGGFDISQPAAMHFTQGLLQHYGWRSFFVDLTASPQVAAWFASHTLNSRFNWQFCENSFEEPVMLGVQSAHYDDHNGQGVLYVLSKSSLQHAGHELVSLVDDLTADTPTRFQVQQAWLASIFRTQRRLDPGTIVATITAPGNLFRSFAEAAGFAATNDLFPPPETDKILSNLLGLPRIEVPAQGFQTRFYVRSLDIPEYQNSFCKHLPPTTALYSPHWISDSIAGAENELWLHVPESIFYSHTNFDIPMPRLCKYLDVSEVLNIESQGLICLPTPEGSLCYEKGISLRRKPDGTIEVCAISIDCVSSRISGCGVSFGYSYELVDGHLVRRPGPTDCNCGDPYRHQLHLRSMAVLEHELGSGRIQQIGNVVTLAD